MCGLAGRFHPVALEPAPGWRERADALLAHRGPDGRGHFADERCELLHRRLALIDLSPGGHQPMPNEDEALYVVFNGEIYNFRELRATLAARGHRFRGASDTEVLVHLYEEEGDRMVERLRGMFAFALYDRRRRRLLLGRDRFGVKPLFVGRHGDEWLFASEMKAILTRPGFEPRLDRQACYDFLGLAYVPEPATGFANVQAVEKGTTLAIDAAGARAREYYRAAANPEPSLGLAEATARVADRLVGALRGQSVADVPVAALLSGGIDSSLVVAAYQRATGGPTTTFNVRFPDRAHDDTVLALAVSRHYATCHHTVDVGDWALDPDTLADLLLHFDQPFADTSLVPTYCVCRAVRDQGIICTLSGDGGDEAFGGYPMFWRAARLVQLARGPAWARRLLRVVGGRLNGWTQDWGRQFVRAAALAEAGRQDPALLLSGLSSPLAEAQKEALVMPAARADLLRGDRHFNGRAPAPALDIEAVSRRLTDSLFAVSLPSEMLRKVDMMSMRASIEVRVPMLDEDVVALGLSLRHGLKTNGRAGKQVLRELARRWLPARIAGHPKRGFHMPIDVLSPPGFHDLLADHLCGPAARTHAVFNQSVVQHWLRDFRAAGGPSHGPLSRWALYQSVLALLSLELWLRKHELVW